MSSSKNILRAGASLPGFEGLLRPVDDADASPKLRNIRDNAEVVYQESRERGYRDGTEAGIGIGKTEGYEAGFATGLKAAEEIQRQKMAEFEARLNTLIESLQQQTEDWYRAAEQRLCALAIEIAQEALGEELSLSREATLKIAVNAVATVRRSTFVRIRVNPSDTAMIEGHSGKFREALAHVKQLEIVGDPAIEAGCIVESDEGIVDARIESYLARIARDLKEVA